MKSNASLFGAVAKMVPLHPVIVGAGMGIMYGTRCRWTIGSWQGTGPKHKGILLSPTKLHLKSQVLSYWRSSKRPLKSGSEDHFNK